MGWNQSIFPLLIVSSNGPGTGFFVYNGAPAKGNLIAAIVAPGTNTDPFGNHVAAVANFGHWSAAGNLLQHFGIDSSGDTYLANTAGATVVREHSADGSVWFYNSAGQGLGNLVGSISPVAGTDVPGNAYKQGIASYGAGGAFALLSAGVMQLGANFQSLPANFNISGSLGASAAVAISSGAGTEAGAAGSLLQLGDSGAGTGLQVIDGADGNTYDNERLILFNTAAVPIPASGFTTVFSKPVSARSYSFSGKMRLKQGAVGSIPGNIGFTGPATSFGLWDSFWRLQGAATTFESQDTVGFTTQVNVLGSQTVANNEVTAYYDGTVTFTAAGTFIVGCQADGTHAFTAQPGCKLTLMSVVAT